LLAIGALGHGEGEGEGALGVVAVVGSGYTLEEGEAEVGVGQLVEPGEGLVGLLVAPGEEEVAEGAGAAGEPGAVATVSARVRRQAGLLSPRELSQ
jgi:hypothetical protein